MMKLILCAVAVGVAAPAVARDVPPVIAPLRFQREAPATPRAPDGPMCSQADAPEQAAPAPSPDAWSTPDGPTERQRAIIGVAARGCELQRRVSALDPWTALLLLRVEEEAGVPADMRGVLLATWCGEAAYRLEPGAGDGGRAVGILQLQRWHAEACGGMALRDDPEASARCYLRRVARLVPRATRACGKRAAWAAAEAWAAQGQRGYTCRESGHVARLRQWAPAMRKALKGVR